MQTRLVVLILSCALLGCGPTRHVVADPSATDSLASPDWTIESQPAAQESPVAQ